MSIQVAILKILASHVSGRATLDSLKHDLAILSSSGDDWHARIKRLASRVPELDIFSSFYVLRDVEGWQITSAGREFLQALEAVTQDNLYNLSPAPTDESAIRAEGTLIVVGHRFKNRMRTQRDPEQGVSPRCRPFREPH
ncbi:aminoacyl-tRNA deacylase [Bradyrhizobium sp. 27S5]|uniref:aminoacyl-tRNA deacylase n=1 Tax=Bradyrhizobium sp. 27S5 TaxID=3139728 RepID=UPI0030D5858A